MGRDYTALVCREYMLDSKEATDAERKKAMHDAGKKKCKSVRVV